MSDERPITPGKIGSTSGTKSSKSKQSKEEGEILGLLRANNISLDSQRLYRRPLLQSFIRDIIDSDRWSEASQKSVERMERVLDDNLYDIEETFLLAVLPCIIKHERAIGRDDTTKEIVLEDWSYTILKMIGSTQPFSVDCVPTIDVVTLARLEDRFKTPKPDRVFGTKMSATHSAILNHSKIRDWIVDYVNICPGIHNPFFIIEGKSLKGNMFGAHTQAIRGGTALVHAMEQIWRSIHDEHYDNPPLDQPQTRSAVFSLTINPMSAELWVHWCQHTRAADGTKPGSFTTQYYMTSIEKFLLSRSADFVMIRRAINNVLDWGIGPRHSTFCNMINAVQMKLDKAVDPGSYTQNKKRKL